MMTNGSKILDQFSLRGKVIVVTGGTGVLGESFIGAIAEAGGDVAVLGRNKEAAEERVKRAEKLGVKAAAVLADVMNETEVVRARNEILERFGTIDGLVNAAGGNIPGATIGPDLDLFGTIIPTHIFGKVMAEKRCGSIVNISSLAASQAVTRMLGYTVAKHGISGYTKWMGTELSLRYGDKVRVNAIAPGVFLTNQT